MINLSEIYDVTLKRGIRGAAKGGFVRPTIGEHFMTHRDFENIISYHDPEFLAKITAPDGAASDYFGNSVAISDTKIVVGAQRGDTPGGADAGSAYIFNTDGTYVTKITAPDGAASDYFGNSVAISDTKIVVGAYLDDDRGSDSGSAYIFKTDGTYVTKITAPDGAAYDYFGNSVAISDTKIVVGARYDDDRGSDSGSAYIYDI